MLLYNTPEKKKVEFKPIVPGKIGVYSCGPTVYYNQHIGNMYAFVCWDVMVRLFKYLGNQVTWVMNVTDVGHLTGDNLGDADTGEDRMEKGAKRDNLSVWEVAKKYEKQFLDSMDSLNIDYPRDKYMPHATDYIQEQIKMVEVLMEKGFAYKISDGIYYDTSKFADYDKFAHLNLEEMKDGARVEKNSEKRNPSDFALWKFSPIGEKRQMEWESPWGVGFPGWHIECTVMSTALLGTKFDIHTGGQEHIKIHHTNEVAQGYGALGGQTANYWLHNGWLQLKDGKMAKSEGTAYTVQDLGEKGYDPLAFRYMVLGTHYAKGMVFSFEGLEAAQVALNKLRKLVEDVLEEGKVEEGYQKLFVEKISDDLAMPEVMALVWKLVKDEKVLPADKKATLLGWDRVLGLNLGKKQIVEEIPEEILKLAEGRKVAKSAKNWAEADLLRDKITSLGYSIEDTATGYVLKKGSL